jgi:hypothetical protein
MKNTMKLFVLLAVCGPEMSVKCDEMCAAGSYSNGDFGCSGCPAGKYSDSAGAVACMACMSGRYSDSAGAVACTECMVGTWNDKAGQTSCIQCGDEKSTDGIAGSTSENACVSSEDVDGTDSMDEADGANIADEADGADNMDVADGANSADEADGADNMDEADDDDYYVDEDEDKDDEYEDDYVDNRTDDTGDTGISGVTCEPGSSVSSDGECTACRAGTYSDKEDADACTNCEADTYSRAGQDQCTECSRDTSTGGETGQSECVSRPDTSYADDDNALDADVLPDGWTDCEPGTYANLVNRTCIACPSGSQTHVVNAEECQPCKEDTYSQDDRSTNCERCPEGENTAGEKGAKLCYPECMTPCVDGTLRCECAEPDEITAEFEKVLYSCSISENGWDFLLSVCSMSEEDLFKAADAGRNVSTSASTRDELASGAAAGIALSVAGMMMV